MNKFFVLGLTLLVGYSYGQEIPSFVLSRTGVAPIVFTYDSLKTPEIYQRCLNWVQLSYKNPEKVVKSKIENELLRIDGFKESACSYKSIKQLIYDMEYTLQIDIKDGKIRLSYEPGQLWTTPYNTKAMFTYSSFFKSSGEVKNAEGKASLENTMNELALSLDGYIKGKKKDDW